MKKKLTTKQVEAKATDDAVKIREWWSSGCFCHRDVCTMLFAVRLADTRFGLLKVCLGRAFEERGDWYELDVIGNGDDGAKDGGHAHYRTVQFALPEKLRKHILREAISMAMTDIAESLSENCSDNPEFCAYIGAVGMKTGTAEAEDIENFANEIMDCGLDDDDGDDKGDGYAPTLRRLAKACKQIWGKGRDMEQAPSTQGFEYD